MLFPSLSTSILGFAALAVAAPHLHSRFQHEVSVREPAPVAERGVTWTPRGLESRGKGRGDKNRKNKNDRDNVDLDITITELSVTNININDNNNDRGKGRNKDNNRNEDIQLVSFIQERIIIVDNSRKVRDNIRRNTFRNKNKNVNTVIIVVTVVIDERDSKNSNKRYMTRQLESNREIEEQVLIVVSEFQTMTIGGNSRRQNAPGVFPTATGVSAAESTGAVQQFGTYDPQSAAQFVGDNSQALLPSGVAAPTWSNAQSSRDPAEIALENPSDGLFVAFNDEDDSNSQQAAIVLSAASS